MGRISLVEPVIGVTHIESNVVTEHLNTVFVDDRISPGIISESLASILPGKA